jgi:N-acylneuraminate cytidylyltransferase
MRTLAIIPARGGSKRLPGKNIKALLDKPLIAWTIEFAKSVTWFDEIQISTDSAEIAAICVEHGIAVSRLRPINLATDTATSVDVALDVVNWRQACGVEFDTVALLQPTTPVRLLERWDAARKMIANTKCEAVVGVSVVDTHPYLLFKKSAEGYLESWVENASKITRSQDYPPAYAVNGSLYLVKVKSLINQRTFMPSKTCSVLCEERVESIDIDTSIDWSAAEVIVNDWLVRSE